MRRGTAVAEIAGTVTSQSSSEREMAPWQSVGCTSPDMTAGGESQVCKRTCRDKVGGAKEDHGNSKGEFRRVLLRRPVQCGVVPLSCISRPERMGAKERSHLDTSTPRSKSRVEDVDTRTLGIVTYLMRKTMPLFLVD